MPITCLIFDYDGIILESVHIKTNAFKKLTEPYGKEAQDRMLMYHKIHGGISRYTKFRWFFSEVLGRDISKEEFADWSTRFEDMCTDAIKNCPLVAGVEQTLKAWHNKLPMYVCSGAPQAELETVLKLKGLEHYFVSIHGSPPAKEELLRSIVAKTDHIPDEVLMIGDSSTDLLAAEAVGTKFYGRGRDFQGGIWPWAEDLYELNNWIETQNS